jgi:hypothetical protein
MLPFQGTTANSGSAWMNPIKTASLLTLLKKHQVRNLRFPHIKL